MTQVEKRLLIELAMTLLDIAPLDAQNRIEKLVHEMEVEDQISAIVNSMTEE